MNVADPLRYPKIDLTEAQVAEIRQAQGAYGKPSDCRAACVGTVT